MCFTNSTMMFENKLRCRSCVDFKSSGSMKSMKVGKALLRCIQQAEKDRRLITGIVDIATELKGCPVDNMYCIMKESCINELHSLLLEAYCREHKVKLIKIDNIRRKTCDSICNDEDMYSLPEDSSFLIKLPTQYSNEDDFIHTFYKTHQLFIEPSFPTVKIYD
ncbi:hypothetical protein ACF0H5_005447 [Mactra antiquata]